MVTANGIDVLYTINTPHYYSNNVGRGSLCEQMDGTLTLVSGQVNDELQADSIADVFPAYEEQVAYTFVSAQGLLAMDFEFSYTGSEAVKVGDYDMHKFTGEMRFNLDSVPLDYPFVAYAVKLETNGAYAYWMVFDISDDHSAGDLLLQHGYNMAVTFREE